MKDNSKNNITYGLPVIFKLYSVLTRYVLVTQNRSYCYVNPSVLSDLFLRLLKDSSEYNYFIIT